MFLAALSHLLAPSFAAETELTQGQGNCEGVAAWALFPALIYCLQTAAQVTRGPKRSPPAIRLCHGY